MLKEDKRKVSSRLLIAERRGEGAKTPRELDDAALRDSGFERVGKKEVWEKEGVYYGRKAALQYCLNVG